MTEQEQDLVADLIESAHFEQLITIRKIVDIIRRQETRIEAAEKVCEEALYQNQITYNLPRLNAAIAAWQKQKEAAG